MEAKPTYQTTAHIYIYILRLSDRTYYTGITEDIKVRLKQHQQGRSISTRRNLPVELVYCTTMPERTLARILEKKIKARGARRYLQDLMFK